MENSQIFRIDVNVNVDFTDNAKKFISSLFSLATTTMQVQQQAQQEQQVQQQTAQTAVEQKDANSAPSAPAAPAQQAVSVTIEDLRKKLSEKVNDHRQEIKDKLTELGAPSVTKLEPSKYQDLYNFLMQL